MDAEESSIDKSFRRYLFLPALFLSVFIHWARNTAFGINLIDVAKTFHVSVGTMSQIPAVGSFIGIFVGLLMGFLSIRFKCKSLWVLGMVISAVSPLGIAFAPNLTVYTFFVSLGAVGGSMVGIMVYALIGEFVPLKKRGWTVGLIASTVYLAGFITSPLTSLITNAAGWQSVLLWYIFPVSTLALFIGLLVLPSNSQQQPTAIKVSYSKAFRQVFSNKSAVACIAAMTLLWTASCIGLYVIAFYRTQFLVSLNVAGIISMVGAALGFIGGVVGGRMVNRVGRKILGVVTGFFFSILIMSFVLVPNLWASIFLRFTATFLFSMSIASFYSLVLEQVPGYRGTMMSLNAALGSGLGNVLGLALGGAVLNLYGNNYQILGIMFGGFGLASMAIVFFLTKDPCKTQLPPSASNLT